MQVTKEEARTVNQALHILTRAGLDIRMDIKEMHEPVLISIPATILVFSKDGQGDIHLELVTRI